MVHLSAGHLQLVKPVTVTRAVGVGFVRRRQDLAPARVTGRGGSYTATFRAPAGVKVSLRTTAADAAGGTIAETITSAYQTSP